MIKIEIGEIYFSVGPLQVSGIEMWKYSNDRFDISREEIGNMFKTKEEAEDFKKMLIHLKNNKR